MSAKPPAVYLARHGETAWSLSRQHTGRTDLPLTERGERNAERLGERLRAATFAKVWTSPLRRAARTCELAGFAAAAEQDADLVEWDYGRYEGRTSAEIQQEDPGWQLFRDGSPGGEQPEQVGARADRVIERVRRGRRRAALLERALPAHAHRALARSPARRRPLLGARHGQPLGARLRTRQPLRTRDPRLERDAPRRRVTSPWRSLPSPASPRLPSCSWTWPGSSAPTSSAGPSSTIR